ncbi:MAG: histidine phosphatase family protein [Alphaproteobacteria bacterium]|nr:histidine phosphatase family protein [Alphaproteobacteria bacterium]
MVATRINPYPALLALLILSGGTGLAAADHKPGPPPSPAMVAALRQGGMVLYLRHGETEKKPDADSVDFDNCATQRNLSDAGRRMAKTIGDGVERLGIPIAEVRTSPFCRARDTGLIAFGQARIDLALLSRGKPDEPEEQARLPQLRLLLSSAPGRPGNEVLVGHSPPMDRLAQVHLDEGEMAVFRPLGDGRFAFLGRIRPEHWRKLRLPQRSATPL